MPNTTNSSPKIETSSFVGVNINSYEPEEIIGNGAFGTVYGVIDPQSGAPCAIKIYAPPQNAEAITDFEREVAIQSRLHHTNIIEIVDSGIYTILVDTLHAITYQYPYLVMPRAHSTLGDQLRNMGQRLSPDNVVRLVADIAAGLDCAHQHGILHRDIKPANILLDGPIEHGGNYMLADFGIAAIVQEPDTPDTLTLQPLALTLGYAAPEQYRRRSTELSDVFSLGIVATRALIGTLPFDIHAHNAYDYYRQLLGAAPVPFERIIPTNATLDCMEAVIRKAIAINPRARFQSAGEFASSLRDAHTAGDIADRNHRVHIPLSTGTRIPDERTLAATVTAPPELIKSIINGPQAYAIGCAEVPIQAPRQLDVQQEATTIPNNKGHIS